MSGESRPRLDRQGAREAPLRVKGDDFQISRCRKDSLVPDRKLRSI